MIQVQTLDGGIAEFLDGTSPEVMRTALRAKLGGGQGAGCRDDDRLIARRPRD